MFNHKINSHKTDDNRRSSKLARNAGDPNRVKTEERRGETQKSAAFTAKKEARFPLEK